MEGNRNHSFVGGVMLGIIGALLVAALGIGGYEVGRSARPTDAELSQARDKALEAAATESVDGLTEANGRRGQAAGAEEGRRSGRRAGGEAGRRAAAREVDAQTVTPAVAPASPPAPPEPTSAPVEPFQTGGCPPGWTPVGVHGGCQAPPGNTLNCPQGTVHVPDQVCVPDPNQ